MGCQSRSSLGLHSNPARQTRNVLGRGLAALIHHGVPALEGGFTKSRAPSSSGSTFAALAIVTCIEATAHEAWGCYPASRRSESGTWACVETRIEVVPAVWFVCRESFVTNPGCRGSISSAIPVFGDAFALALHAIVWGSQSGGRDRRNHPRANITARAAQPEKGGGGKEWSFPL